MPIKVKCTYSMKAVLFTECVLLRYKTAFSLGTSTYIESAVGSSYKELIAGRGACSPMTEH